MKYPTLAICLGLLAPTAVFGGVAHANVSDFEGTWKAAAPAVSLKPESGTIPFTATGRKAYDTNRKLKAQHKIDDYDITTSRCSNPGIPRLALTPGRFKIWQDLGVMTFDYEWNRAIRQIDMRGTKPEPLLVPNMTGQSLGHMEGDTLVESFHDACQHSRSCRTC